MREKSFQRIDFIVPNWIVRGELTRSHRYFFQVVRGNTISPVPFAVRGNERGIGYNSFAFKLLLQNNYSVICTKSVQFTGGVCGCFTTTSPFWNLLQLT